MNLHNITMVPLILFSASASSEGSAARVETETKRGDRRARQGDHVLGTEGGIRQMMCGFYIHGPSWLATALCVIGPLTLPAATRANDVSPIYQLWSGTEIPKDPVKIPFAEGLQHITIHRPGADDDKFLHGASIVHHRGILYANWANSPTNENGPHETLQGKRSTDGGLSWSPLEIVGRGFPGDERHSHGVLMEHQGEVWTIAARFGVGIPGKKFPGLQAEAFVLNRQTDRWDSRGVVMKNCWPYDAPVKMANGDYITGGQDKDGLPVVAISHGDDFSNWDTLRIPYHPKLAPSYAETTVWADGSKVIAVIRGGGGVAWVASSEDHGRSWTTASASNLPMPRAKAYLGKLSTDQLFLLANFRNRDTLVIWVGQPGAKTLNSVWRIRHGKSEAPRFPGRAKGKQWSYPYAHEHDGNLYIVYSIGKEECGLSILPIKSVSDTLFGGTVR